jgi:hypothetical protein
MSGCPSSNTRCMTASSSSPLRPRLHAPQEDQHLNRARRPEGWHHGGRRGRWLVSFMHYDLGYIDLEQRTLQPLDNALDGGDIGEGSRDFTFANAVRPWGARNLRFFEGQARESRKRPPCWQHRNRPRQSSGGWHRQSYCRGVAPAVSPQWLSRMWTCSSPIS